VSYAAFPVLSADDVRRELAVARATPNVVSLQIRASISKPVLKRVCAWCGKGLGQTHCVASMSGQVTHGICEDCAAVHFTNDFQREASGKNNNADEGVRAAGVSGTMPRAASTAGDAKHQCMKSLRAEPAACERKQAGILTDQLLPNTGA
jgi:hypothetical protein